MIPRYPANTRTTGCGGPSRAAADEVRINSANPPEARYSRLMTRNCAPAPNAEMMTPESSDPNTIPTCMLTEFSDIPLSASFAPTMSYVSDWRVVIVNAVTQPLRAVSARMCQSRARSASSAAAITPEAAAAATVTARSSRLRFIRSATAPETGPRKKNGAIARADATAVKNGEPVISNTIHPVTTQFIPKDADWSSTHIHSSRKSGNSNERAHLGPVTPAPRTTGRQERAGRQRAPTA